MNTQIISHRESPRDEPVDGASATSKDVALHGPARMLLWLWVEPFDSTLPYHHWLIDTADSPHHNPADDRLERQVLLNSWAARHAARLAAAHHEIDGTWWATTTSAAAATRLTERSTQ